MIARLSGKLTLKQAQRLILDVGGVGYELWIPLSSFYDLPEPGSPLTMEVAMWVREDNLQLFGFLTAREKTLFQKLLGISGVGPKMALAVLSKPVGQVVAAIAGGDVSVLRSVPGVGKKTAERILLELRDGVSELTAGTLEDPPGPPRNSQQEDAVSALLNLGYARQAAERAVEEAAKSGTGQLSGLLTRALAELAK